MRRPERRATLRQKVAWLRETVPDIALRSTAIVGFPGETGGDFRHYYDGITPSVGRLIDAVDRERLAVAAALGVRGARRAYYDSLGGTPAISRDGVEIELWLNAGLPIDLEQLEATGSVGIGLFRTELPFMIRSAFPGVDEQTEFYRSVFERAGGRPITFRTLDIGGDKALPYLDHLTEDNPAMGWRAIRIGLDRPVGGGILEAVICLNRETCPWLALDIPSGLHANTGAELGTAVRAAATLTGPILRSGNRLGMLVYGPGMESVFPGYGKVQQQRILRALARAGAGHNYALESLAHIPTRFFPSGSQIILISPLSPEDPPLVSNLAMLGYGVLVISPNPLIFVNVGKNGALLSQDDLAWRLATAERRFQIQSMQRAAVRVIDWDVRQSLAPLLQIALRRH